MIDPDWGNPEPVLPDPSNPADDEDFADRMKKLDEEAELLMMANHTCTDCGKNIDGLTVHEHVLIHRKLGI